MLDSFQVGQIPAWYYLAYWVSTTIVFLLSLREKQGLIHKNSEIILLFAFFVLFAVTYCVGRDYFQYRYHVQEATQWISSKGQEAFYQRLSYLCNGDYDLFRLIVWGGALICVYFAAKVLNLPVYLALLFLFVFFCDKFCYARASLGMAVFFLGFSVLIKSKHNILKILIGIGLILTSTYFHRSILVLLAIVPLSFLPINQKSSILISSVSIIALCALLYFYDAGLGLINSYLDEGGVERFENYTTSFSEGTGSWASLNRLGTIVTAINNLFFFCFFFAVYRHRKRFADITYFNRLFSYVCVLMALSLALLVVFGLNNPFCYRILYMAQIPLLFLFIFLFSRGCISRASYRFLLIYAFFSHTVVFLDGVL